jgi:hypothetical protein
MQLPASTIAIETSTTFKEVEFSIKDPRIILEYMRKSIYSNPIKAIVQEIMSNARDAHREVGRADLPIRVKIPNAFNMNWECSDSGPGIDPERMEKVFVNFGESTKRGNGEHATDDGKLQTGGFGIGSKTPWAYTDNFTIVTTAWEGDQLVRRTYMAVIADDRRNKLMELPGSEEILDPSNDSTGTTLIVPVKNMSDAQDFTRWVKSVAHYWDVKPEVSGGDFEWGVINKSMSGNGWSYDRNASYSYAIIDGIPYPIDTQPFNFQLSDYNERAMSIIVNRGFVIHFPVNSISVALSRENIQYDQATITVIRNRLEEIVKEIRSKLDVDAVSASNLKDAILIVKDIVDSLGGIVFSKIMWTNTAGQSFDATSTIINNRSHSGNFFEVYPKDCADDRKDLRRLKYEKFHNLPIRNNVQYIIHDDATSRVPITKLVKMFQDNLSIQSAIIIPHSVWSKPEWIALGIQEIGAVFSSTMPRGKLPKLPKDGSSASRDYVRVDALQYDFATFNWKKIEQIDTTVESFYVLYNRINCIGHFERIRTAGKWFPGTPIYAIRSSVFEKLEECDNLIPIEDAIKEECIKRLDVVESEYRKYYSYLRLMDYIKLQFSCNSIIRDTLNYAALSSVIENLSEDNPLKKIVILYDNTKKECNQYKGFDSELETMCSQYGCSGRVTQIKGANDKHIDIAPIVEEIRNRYPYLCGDDLRIYDCDKKIKFIKDYVSLVERANSVLTMQESAV